MGLFSDLFGGSSNSSSNTTSTSDNRIGASDNAGVITGQSNQSGGVQFRTSNGGNITVQSLDAQIAHEAFGLVENVVSSQSNLQLSTAHNYSAALSDVNQRLSDLSTTKVTDGANLNQKTTIVAVIVLGVLGAIFFFFTRKH